MCPQQSNPPNTETSTWHSFGRQNAIPIHVLNGVLSGPVDMSLLRLWRDHFEQTVVQSSSYE